MPSFPHINWCCGAALRVLALLGVGGYLVLLGGCANKPPDAPGIGLPIPYVLRTGPWEAKTPTNLGPTRPVARPSGKRWHIGQIVVTMPAGWRLLHPPRLDGAVAGTLDFAVPAPGTPAGERRLNVDVLPADLSSIRDYVRYAKRVWEPYISREYGGHVRRFFEKYRSVWSLYHAVYRTNLRVLYHAGGGNTRRARCLLWLRGSESCGRVEHWYVSKRMRAALWYPTPRSSKGGGWALAAVLFGPRGDVVGGLVVRGRKLSADECTRAAVTLISLAGVRERHGTTRPG